MPSPRLPKELLTEIFTLLSPNIDALEHHFGRSTLFECSLVSRDWHTAALPLIWSYLRIDCYNLSSKRTFERLASSMTGAPQILARGIGLVANIELIVPPIGVEPNLSELLPSIVQTLQLFSRDQLRRIDISYMHHRNNTFFSALLSTLFPLICGLQHLEIYGISSIPTNRQDFPASFDRIFSLEKVENFSLSSLNTIPPEYLLGCLRTRGPQLRRLNITNCQSLLCESILRAVTDHCPNLTTLELRLHRSHVNPSLRQDITENTLCRLIDLCPRLKELRLFNIYAVSNIFLAHCAGRAHCMRALYIHDFLFRTTGEGVVDLSAWEGIRELVITHHENAWNDVKMDARFVWEVERQTHGLTVCQLGRDCVSRMSLGE
ncbi:hypothetical protein BC938DRAFT_472702 [Jimgerdemannia flammicorona]|uniref:F-box domain-containing protein n=1 Tax=Jimgerdemannia flammicorona TaxID=994334 RepID=A0A433Q5J0_9FUNG|nr:hypothetical protein BC938DRAFT_472702 [Jimgerdemannia flammicorona]